MCSLRAYCCFGLPPPPPPWLLQVTVNSNLNLTEEENKMRNERGNVCAIVSRSIRGKTLMYECRRTGRKDKDNTWEPLNFLQVSGVGANPTRHGGRRG